MGKNWHTTLAGLGSILTGIGSFLTSTFDGDIATEPNYTAIVAAIVLGWGLIKAKDASNPN